MKNIKQVGTHLVKFGSILYKSNNMKCLLYLGSFNACPK